MMRWLLALALTLATSLPLAAQTVRVRTGEHADFTRLVLEFPQPVDWRLGRTEDGYEMRLANAKADYDLSGAFDLIAKSRLAALAADPETGALRLSIGCACHAIPFEFRPGTIVIDLRDGPPPSGSSFEEPFEAADTGETRAENPPPRPQAALAEVAAQTQDPVPAQAMPEKAPGPIYDWTAALLLPDKPTAAPDVTLLDRNLKNPSGANAGLEPLRQSLIEELGKGATQGIVEMAPPTAGDPAETDLAERHAVPDPLAQDSAPVDLRLGDELQLEIRQKGEEPKALASSGQACIPQDKLAIGDWAEATPIAEQIGPALSGLVGEFDRPDPEAVARAVKFYLHLGFGAEARAILRALPGEQEDAAIWLSLANLLDGKPDHPSAFAGMSACDGAAALWALLADPEVLALGQVEKAAVLRSFSALPPHLRQDLGPRLVERFLEMKDLATATTLRDAVLRGRPEATAETEMMEAALERAAGSPVASEARLSDLARDPGTSASDVLTALVIQRAEIGQEVSFDQVQALEAFAQDHADGEEHDRLQMALTLAYGASGDFAKAFERLPDTPDAAAVIWQLLARSGRDSPLLEHAVLPEADALPKEARPVATLIAQRLVTLGLADQAARWLAMEPEPPPLLAAKVALGSGDPERALRLLGEERSVPADDLRLAAYRAMQDEDAIASLSAELDLSAEEWAAVSRMRDWPRLAADGPDPWKEAASRLVGTAVAGAASGEASAEGGDPALAAASGQAAAAPLGQLERDRLLVGESEATRAAILALLDSVRAPTAPATQ